MYTTIKKSLRFFDVRSRSLCKYRVRMGKTQTHLIGNFYELNLFFGIVIRERRNPIQSVKSN